MEDDDIYTPNCPRCLVRLSPEVVGGQFVWRCPECGMLKLS